MRIPRNIPKMTNQKDREKWEYMLKNLENKQPKYLEGYIECYESRGVFERLISLLEVPKEMDFKYSAAKVTLAIRNLDGKRLTDLALCMEAHYNLSFFPTYEEVAKQIAAKKLFNERVKAKGYEVF